MVELIDITGKLWEPSDEEITELVADMLKDRGKDPIDFLYRGISCSEKGLSHLLSAGTDRTEKAWQKAIKKFIRDERREGVDDDQAPDIIVRANIEHATYSTNPNYIWATNDLQQAVSYMDWGKSVNALLVYRANQLEKLKLPGSEDLDNEYYRFVNNPREALDSVFIRRWKKEKRV